MSTAFAAKQTPHIFIYGILIKIYLACCCTGGRTGAGFGGCCLFPGAASLVPPSESDGWIRPVYREGITSVSGGALPEFRRQDPRLYGPSVHFLGEGLNLDLSLYSGTLSGNGMCDWNTQLRGKNEIFQVIPHSHTDAWAHDKDPTSLILSSVVVHGIAALADRTDRPATFEGRPVG